MKTAIYNVRSPTCRIHHLRLVSSSWKDIEAIESIQHRATKVPQEMKQFDYETRCTKLGLTSLRQRRIRGDLIQKYKIDNDIDSVNWHIVPRSIPPSYGHRTRFHREIVSSCLVRQNFFNNRVASHWNALPDNVAHAHSVDNFKANYDSLRS